MKITLFHCHESRSMRVLWLLNELNIDYKVEVLPFDGLRTEEYIDIHPLARVPSIEYQGEVMFESLAICQYLCEKISPTRLGRAPENKERAAWLQWVNYSETMAVHGANLVQQYIVVQPSSLRSDTVIKLEKRRLEKSIDVIEPVLDQQEYMLNSGFSLADIAIGYSLHLASKFVSLNQWPSVNRYYEHLSQREAFMKSLPASDDPLRIFKEDFG